MHPSSDRTGRLTLLGDDLAQAGSPAVVRISADSGRSAEKLLDLTVRPILPGGEADPVDAVGDGLLHRRRLSVRGQLGNVADEKAGSQPAIRRPEGVNWEADAVWHAKSHLDEAPHLGARQFIDGKSHRADQ